MTEFELKEKKKIISDESEQNNDDQIEDSKHWAISQKKSQKGRGKLIYYEFFKI